MEITLITSRAAEKRLRRQLNKNELLILNYLHSKGGKDPCESAVMCDMVRSRLQSYKDILDLFCHSRIIKFRGKYHYDKHDFAGNFCRRIALNDDIVADLKAKKNVVKKEVKMSAEAFDFEDTSLVIDRTTQAVFNNLSKLEIDQEALDKAVVNVEGFIILRKFVAGIRNVKKSNKTGRISHLLLNAGSKQVRSIFRIKGEKPADIDGKSFHWQLIKRHLSINDRVKLDEIIDKGFYESIMAGTGVTDRTLVKRKSQQVLTNKRIHKTAIIIREWLFAQLPSLQSYCKKVWASGRTVQATLQGMEAEYINALVDDFDRMGKWIIPFYDGVWVEQGDAELFLTMAEQYIFEVK
jgi:hypothetical protein